MPHRNLTLSVVAVVVLVAGRSAAGEGPQPVSPGDPRSPAEVEMRCPTFSWGAVSGAEGYDLVVYALEDAPVTAPTRTEPVLEIRVHGSASSWTPSGEHCLTAGRLYAWALKAEGAAGADAWSQPRLFRVAAGPTPNEVEEALATLQSFLTREGATTPDGVPGSPTTTVQEPTTSSADPGSEAPAEAAIDTLAAAIRAEQSDGSGDTAGVVATSSSPAGVGLAAANEAGGADLLLDGTADGETDTTVTQSGIARTSTGAETFEFVNPGAGSMELRVGGVEVVTTATDSDTLAGLACAGGEIAKWNGASWVCGSDVDTDTLGGLSCAPGEIAKLNESFDWVCAADDGGALAYAQVNADATLVAGRSKNVDGVTHRLDPISMTVEAGFYCFDLADGIDVSNVVATLQFDLIPDPDKQLAATVDAAAIGGCPAGFTDALVAYHSAGGGSGVDRNFFVLFN